MKNTIIVALPLEDRHKEAFREILREEDAELIFTTADEVTEAELREATVVIGNLKPTDLKKAPKVKWVQLNSAGTDGYLEEGVLPKGTVVTNATGAYGLAISEYMLGITLSIMKKFPLYHDQQKQALWQSQGKVTSVYGSTVLVVGMGDIGSEYALRMKTLGSYVIGIRRTPGEKPDFADEVYTLDRLEECLSRADVVAASLPGTAQTYHLFDEKRFEKMKDGAIFINVGRGGAVESKALAKALKTGKLMGAGIDVAETEPLPPDSELWEIPNLLITPHVSGGYHLPETLERIIRISLDNLEAYLHGKTMKSVVDFATGYRAR